MKRKITIAELKEIIKNLPDDGDLKISNGHSVWDAIEYEYEADALGYPIGIIIINPNMPK